MNFWNYAYKASINLWTLHPLSHTFACTHKLPFPCEYILAWTCKQQPWQYSSEEVPSSCSRGLVGVGGQFCSLKEKQISGTRGLVLLRPLQGCVGSSIGELYLEVSLVVVGLFSSALSSGYGIKAKVIFMLFLRTSQYGRGRWVIKYFPSSLVIKLAHLESILASGKLAVEKPYDLHQLYA